MKKINTLGLIFTAILIVFGCEKIKDPAGVRNVAVIPVISDINPGIFDSKDLQHSFVQFRVAEPQGAHIDKATVIGSYKNNLERVEIAEITDFPATVKILSSDFASKLGISLGDVKNGDTFTIELLSEANGMTTRSNAVLNVSVACAFDKAMATGSYHSVSADWNSEGTITITADPADPYKLYVSGLEEIEGLDEDKGPLVMHIDPATYAVTADQTALASDAWGYHNLSYEGFGTYNSCDGSFVMYFDISADEGSFGRFTFSFTRN